MKRSFYIFSVMILLILIISLVDMGFEYVLIRFFDFIPANPVEFYGYSIAAIIVFGVIGGHYLGRYWWRIIYIEKRYGRIKY